MYRLIKVLAVFIINGNFIFGPAIADVPWGSDDMQAWYPYCKMGAVGRNSSILNDAELLALGYCMGAVRSAANVGNYLCNTDANTGVGSAALRANNQTLSMVVSNFYEENVQYLSSMALSSVAFIALSTAYPCD